MNRKHYRIIRTAQNAWNMDGSPIVEIEHTVLHRSLKAAHIELDRLRYAGCPSGMQSGRWAGAYVSEAYADGGDRFGVDEDDREQWLEIEYAQGNKY